MERVVLLPLDDRPLNYAAVARAAAMLPFDVVFPPRELIGSRERTPDLFHVTRWVMSNSADAALVLSLDALLFGGLIQARAAKPGSPRAQEGLKLLKPIASRASSASAFLVWKRVWGNILTQRSLERMPLFEQASLKLAEMAHENGVQALYERLAIKPEPLCGLPLDDVSLLATTRYAMLLEAIQAVQACSSENIQLHIAVEDSIRGGVQEEELGWLRANSNAPFTICDGADEAGAVLLAAKAAMLPGFPNLKVYAGDSIGTIAPYESMAIGDNLRTLCKLAAAEMVLNADDARLHISGSPENCDLFTSLTSGELSVVEPDTLLDSVVPAQSFRDMVNCELTATNGINPQLLENFAKDTVPPLAISQMNTVSNRIGHAFLLALATSAPVSDNELAQLIVAQYIEDLFYNAYLRTWAVNKFGGIEPEDEATCNAAETEMSLIATAFAQRKFNGACLMGKHLHVGCVRMRLPWKRWFECEVEVEATLI
jgi:hypothetical protein